MPTEKFPIDFGKLLPLKLDPAVTSLTDAQRDALRQNIQLARDAIVFFTSLAGARGLSRARVERHHEAIPVEPMGAQVSSKAHNEA